MTVPPASLGLRALPAVAVLAVLCGCVGRGEKDRDKEPPLSAAEEQQVQEFLQAARRQAEVMEKVVAALKTVVDWQSRDDALKVIRKDQDEAAAAERDFARTSAGLSTAAKLRAQQDPVAERLMVLLRDRDREAERIRDHVPGGVFFLKALGPVPDQTKSP